MPFWHGDSQGRPLELGRALGAFLREVGSATPEAGLERARAAGLDEWGAANLQAYLAEQKAATGHLPDDRTLLVERFRDELGDWRLVVHSPFGAQVNAPVGAGARPPGCASATGVDVAVDALRRRHRAAAARHHRRAARGRPRRPRPGRRRARGHRRGRQLGAVRQPVPGVRRPGAAAPPPRPAPAHPAVAAAAARGPAAVGGQRVLLVPDHPRGGPRGACRTCTTSPGWSS